MVYLNILQVIAAAGSWLESDQELLPTPKVQHLKRFG